MKVILLAGGLGTRLSEETAVKPKPMVEIGGQPILWHIMMHYTYYGYKNFLIALGYKGEVIKKYMMEYCLLSSNLSINLQTGDIRRHNGVCHDWLIELIDTGAATETGGRLKRLAPYIANETFMATYGDGVSNVNLHELVNFHRSHGKLATVTAVHPPARFGLLDLNGDNVAQMSEKPPAREGWINSGFFVLEPEVFDYIDGDATDWSRGPMERLAQEGQLKAFKHPGFWQCMDTLRDKTLLESLWQAGNPPWKIWA
jgi:glucose-1-phosphate cytidylyltransferase